MAVVDGLHPVSAPRSAIAALRAAGHWFGAAAGAALHQDRGRPVMSWVPLAERDGSSPARRTGAADDLDVAATGEGERSMVPGVDARRRIAAAPALQQRDQPPPPMVMDWLPAVEPVDELWRISAEGPTLAPPVSEMPPSPLTGSASQVGRSEEGEVAPSATPALPPVSWMPEAPVTDCEPLKDATTDAKARLPALPPVSDSEPPLVKTMDCESPSASMNARGCYGQSRPRSVASNCCRPAARCRRC